MKITFGNVYQNNIMHLSFDQTIPLTEISLKDKKGNKTKKLNAQVIHYLTILKKWVALYTLLLVSLSSISWQLLCGSV